MKKLISMLLVITSLALLLSACGQDGEASKSDDASQAVSESTTLVSNASCTAIRDDAYAYEKADPEVHQLYDSKDDPMDEFLISGYYGTLLESPDFTKLDSYAVFITDEPIVSEFGVFKASADMTVDEIKAFCQLRVDALKKKFEGYKPEMVNAANGSVIGVYGDYVYYISTMENNTSIEEKLKTLVDFGKQ